MTTMIVRMENNANIGNIAATIRQLNGVADVMVQKEMDFGRIPGLSYTCEERMADIRKAEDDYARGRTITSEELEKRMAIW